MIKLMVCFETDDGLEAEKYSSFMLAILHQFLVYLNLNNFPAQFPLIGLDGLLLYFSEAQCCKKQPKEVLFRGQFYIV